MQKTVCDAITGMIPWAILGNTGRDHMTSLLSHQNAFLSYWGDYKEPDVLDTEVNGNVTTVKVYGTILHGVGYYKWASVVDVLLLKNTITQLSEDKSVKKIVLDFDSPGGTVTGIEECAELIYNISKSKKITAYTSGLMCSAAYWLAAACSEIVVTKTSETGSIGVRMRHIEYSVMDEKMGIKITDFASGEWKTLGNDSKPLSDKEIKKFQSMVDDLADMFFESVARYRNMDVKDIKAMEADVFLGSKAVENGLADRLDVLDNLKSGKGSSVYKSSTFKSLTLKGSNPMNKLVDKIRAQFPDTDESVLLSVACQAETHLEAGFKETLKEANKLSEKALADAATALQEANAKTAIAEEKIKTLEATVENSNKQVIANTWLTELSGSTGSKIPADLHADLQATVSAESFTKDNVLDAEGFLAAVKEKVGAWSKNFKTATKTNTPVVQGGGGGSSVEEIEAGGDDDDKEGYSLEHIKSLKS